MIGALRHWLLWWTKSWQATGGHEEYHSINLCRKNQAFHSGVQVLYHDLPWDLEMSSGPACHAILLVASASNGHVNGRGASSQVLHPWSAREAREKHPHDHLGVVALMICSLWFPLLTSLGAVHPGARRCRPGICAPASTPSSACSTRWS